MKPTATRHRSQSKPSPVQNLLGSTLLGSFQCCFFVLRSLPRRCALVIVTLILQGFLIASKKHLRIARRNVEIAFPDKPLAEREQIIHRSIREFARLIVDAARLPLLDDAWIRDQIEFPNRELFERLHREGKTGCIIATGHLGSFELLAHSAAIMGFPLSFIVRDFTIPKLDKWWRSIREAKGNTVISRRGAYRQMVRDLKSGRDVGILFDQNVTRNRAVFVDFFGRPAATTRALGLAAASVQCPVVVSCVQYLGRDRYRICCEEIETHDLYTGAISRDDVVRTVTERASRVFEGMVRERPEAWFWMHRRWRTTPREGGPATYESYPQYPT